MGTILDLKNAVRKAIYDKDKNINFYFNEILKVQYPYIFFQIKSYNPKGILTPEYLKNRQFMCIIEYAKSENNTTTELSEYEDIILEMISNISLYGSYLNIIPETLTIDYVDGVLQIVFNATHWIKLEDYTQLMEELNLTIK